MMRLMLTGALSDPARRRLDHGESWLIPVAVCVLLGIAAAVAALLDIGSIVGAK